MVCAAAAPTAASPAAVGDDACPLPAPDAVEAPPRRVALASYPRTGSTWARFLVERATGRPTGTNCVGYNGVLERAPTGVVVKTHRHGVCRACGAYARASVETKPLVESGRPEQP